MFTLHWREVKVSPLPSVSSAIHLIEIERCRREDLSPFSSAVESSTDSPSADCNNSFSGDQLSVLSCWASYKGPETESYWSGNVSETIKHRRAEEKGLLNNRRHAESL